jgi:hypothetical protein
MIVKRLIVATMLTALVASAWAGPALTASSWRGNRWVTPSGDFACILAPKYVYGLDLVRCINRNNGWGLALWDDESGGQVAWRGTAPDRFYRFFGPTLPYGIPWVSNRGTIRCVARRISISCYRGSHGFALRLRTYSIW